MSRSAAAKESHVDVLIVGAGPAGVMCANALVQAGVNVRIVDKRPEGLMAGQADGCQPRSLEILHSYDSTLTEKLFKRGEVLYKTTFYNPGPCGGIEKTSSAVSINAPSARWEYSVSSVNLHQGGIEGVLLEAMAEKGFRVERSTVPTAIELSQDPEGLQDPTAHVAKVTLKNLERAEDEVEVVHAKFLLGSDGAHSWVRKTLDINMEGDNTESIWGVIDMVPDTNFPDFRTKSFVHSRDGMVFIIPRENDMIRLYIQQGQESDVIDPATGRADKNRTSPEKLMEQGQKIMQPYRMEIKDGKVVWWTVYVVGQRVAEKFSVDERAFIAGDACHTHSPKAGQGLNASMGDTHNLAWKVAYVLRGWSPLSILTTYESERRTYAQELIDFDKWFSKLFSRRPRTDENEDGVTHEQFLSAFKTASGFTSGIAIRYRPSSIVNGTHQSLASNLVIGERMIPHVFIRAASSQPIELQDMLPADTRFKVLVFAGNIADDTDRAKLEVLGEELNKPENFLRRYGRGDSGKWQVFDVACFSAATKDKVGFFDFPEFFRWHWTKVLLDDKDMHERSGGGGYAKYGIDEHAGAIVVVRPDGYVGTVAFLEDMAFLNSYFAAFLLY
ncbi:FAD binding domain-containing protein [Ganoderma leucocontextum]|nr:FAD binding domain-containing protein [Ganoderma leucocontextum]